MSLQRQHFLLSYLKTLSFGPAGEPALSQLSQPGGTRFNHHCCHLRNKKLTKKNYVGYRETISRFRYFLTLALHGLEYQISFFPKTYS